MKRFVIYATNTRTRVIGFGKNGEVRVLCGAKTRKGTPCMCESLSNGRCKFHGGLSTGPKSPEGKIRALANLKQYQNKGSQ